MNIRMWGSGRFLKLRKCPRAQNGRGTIGVRVLSNSVTHFKEKRCLDLVPSLKIYKMYPLNILQGLTFSDNM
jgi:hypothetical protein